MFEGIDDSSDDESLGSMEGAGDEEEEVVGPIEVEGQEVSAPREAVERDREGKDKTEAASVGEAKGDEKGDEGSRTVVV